MPKPFKNTAHRRAKMQANSKRYRELNRIRYLYTNTKNRARQRGKEFTISYEYFERWCMSNSYHLLTGNEAASMTIDRDNNELGYVEGNLVMRSRSDNTAKENVRRVGIEWNTWKGLDHIENF